MYPKQLELLIESFKLLPGVGQKTAERYALHMLDVDIDHVEIFSSSLVDAKQDIKNCKICNNLSDGDICTICKDGGRDKSVICVVSNAKEAYTIEKTRDYNGTYHVLGGLISTKKGVMPEDIAIKELEARIDSNTSEVILALNATVEGEMTALYIAKKLENVVDVTRLAFGLPIGGHLDYADDMTLMKAFEGRKRIV